MQILTIYQGTSATDFKQYPKIGLPQIDMGDADVQHTIMLSKKALGMGKIFWYHIQLDEFDPVKKTHQVMGVWTDSVEEKKPIILNARARVEGLSAKTTIKPIITGGDFFNFPPVTGATPDFVVVGEETEEDEE